LNWEIVRLFKVNTKKTKKNSAKKNPINPPTLLGIERKIAYRWRKYHSGWMWRGEFERSELIKLTGSEDQSGKANIKTQNIHIKPKLTKSLKEKRCPNLIKSPPNRLIPPGTDLPLKCNKIKCTPAKPKTAKGKIKWKA